jgi:iron complex outermembrane recepter protein
MTALRTVLLGCLLGGVFLSTAGGAEPARLSADIGPRPLVEALTAFGRQTGLQLIYVSSVAETQQSKGAPAGLTAPAALTQLLDGTGLSFEFLNTRTVRIFPAPTVVPTPTASSAVPPRHSAPRVLVLEEVVVTGTRGQQPLSRVPVDMVVWTRDAMEASGIKGMAQLGPLTPGVDSM